MGQKGMKRGTGTMTAAGATYGPFEFTTVTDGKLTRSVIKKRRGAGGARYARPGSADMDTLTCTLEVTDDIDLKDLWNRKGRWTIVVVPLDDDGNPKARNTVTRTGYQSGLDTGDVDIEDDENIDMASLEFTCDSLVA